MNTEHLPEQWSSRSRSKTSTQLVSYRLPTFLTAQIDALAVVFPLKNRTEIVTDLLMAAIEELDQNLPTDPIPATDDGIAFKGGKRNQFRYYANGFFKLREKSWVEPIFLNEKDF